MKALIVSQSKTFIRTARLHLRECGATNIASARTAIETFNSMIREERNFDFIILDGDLPDLSGTDLCRVIRTTPGYEVTPIMIVSETLHSKGADAPFLAGASDYRERNLRPNEAREWIKLVQEISKTYEGCHATQRRSGECVLTIPSDPSHKACIRGVRSFVDRYAIDNYIARLPRGIQFHTKVFSISINRFPELSGELSFQHFGLLLLIVGAAISKACKFDRQLFCYNGNGQYICVHQNQHELQRGATEELIRRELQIIRQREQALAPLKLDITVGREMRANGIFRSSHDIESDGMSTVNNSLKGVFPSRRRIVSRFLTA